MSRSGYIIALPDKLVHITEAQFLEASASADALLAEWRRRIDEAIEKDSARHVRELMLTLPTFAKKG